MRAAFSLRDATELDADACAEVYAPYVRDTTISFETDPPTPAEMGRRISRALATHAWLVLEDADAQLVGYAYGGPFASRAAYRWSCEVSVYLGQDQRRRGGGRALYGALLLRLADRGYRTALAGMTLPNDASEALHRAMGFERSGTYRHVGFKHGAWRDVGWMQRAIGSTDDVPGDVPGDVPSDRAVVPR